MAANQLKHDKQRGQKVTIERMSENHFYTSETSFAKEHLMPAIRRVLLQNASEELLYTKSKQKEARLHDWHDGQNKELYFFFVEVKRPDTTSKHQPEDDYEKLMEHIKDSIDKQLRLRAEIPSSLGLMAEGFCCRLLQTMTLTDGLYLPTAITRFSLGKDIHHLVHLPSIIEALYYVKRELNKFDVRVNKKKTSKEKKSGTERVYVSFETKFEAKKKVK